MIGIPRPDASDRQVQENKVRLMELVISVGVSDLLSAILNSIHEVVDVICIPDHADNMETIRKCTLRIEADKTYYPLEIDKHNVYNIPNP